MKKLCKKKKLILIGIAGIIILIIVGIVGALNGYFGGGGKIPEDTFTRGLVGYWSFDEGGGNTAYDASGNGNNGTLNNGPAWTTGKIGGALSFDGVDDYVEIADTDQQLASDALTFEAWIKILPGWSEYERIVTKKGSLPWNGTSGWSLEINSGGRMTFLGSGGEVGDRLSLGWQENRWHHVVITKESGATIVKGYLDGTYKDDQTCNTIQPNTQPLTFAYYPAEGSYLPIIIDEVRIYNRALSEEEIRYHYNHGGPVGHWKFDEGIDGRLSRAFEDGFENNNFYSWTGTYNSPQIQSTVKYQGTYAMLASVSSSTAKYAYRDLYNMREIYVRLYVRFSALQETDWDANTFLYVYATSDTPLVIAQVIKEYEGVQKWRFVYRDGQNLVFSSVFTDPVPKVNEWYCVEVRYKIAENNQGVLQSWVNGELKSDISGIDSDDFGPVMRFAVGEIYPDFETPHDTFIDNVVVSSNYIGPENFVLDYSGNKNLGIAYGVQPALAKYGGGYYFDGGDYIEIPNSATLNISKKITIELWAKKEISKYWGNDLNTYGNYWYLTSANYKVSQRFTARENKTVDKVIIYGYGNNSPTYRLSIQGDNNGLPDGNILGYADITFPAGYNWVEIDISDTTLTAGQVYHIVLEYYNGTIDGDHYFIFLAWEERDPRIPFDLKSDFQLEVLHNYGSGWVPWKDLPRFVLVYSDGTTFGNHWSGELSHYFGNVYGTIYRGEQFKPPEDMYVTHVGFYIRKNGTPSKLYVSLYNVTDGQYLVNSEEWVEPIGESFHWVDHKFSTPQFLQKNKVYQIFLKSPDSPDNYNRYVVYTWYTGTSDPKATSISFYGTSSQHCDTEYGNVPLNPYWSSMDLKFRFKLVPQSYNAGVDNFIEKIIRKGTRSFALEILADPSGDSKIFSYINNYEVSAPISNPFEWHHYVLIYDGSNQKLYIDGSLVNSIPQTGTIYMDLSPIRIGEYFQGWIDDVRIYNYARTPEEIRLDYNAGYAARFGPHSSCDIDPGSCMNLGLVGYWSFDEGGGNTAYDASGNGNNGTLNNGPTWTTGKIGGALSFDGVDDYVEISENDILDFVNTLTIETWIKTSIACRNILSKKPSQDSVGVGYEIHVGCNKEIVVAIYDGSNLARMYNAANTVTDDKWHHVVVLMNKTNDDENYIYVDGNLIVNGPTEGSFENLGNVNNTLPFRIGTTYWSSLVFNGFIDEVRIYNRALSEAEIRYHYNRGGPIAHWKFDEGSGDTASDSSGQGNHGTIYGATWTSGKYGSALSFDGTNDYVEITKTDNLKLLEGTFEAWVKINSFPESDLETILADNSYELHLTPGKQFQLWTSTSGSFNSNSQLTTGTWYHLVATYTSSTQRLFINGVLDSEEITNGVLTTTDDNLFIGADWYIEPIRYFNGIIDDIRIYNYARTPEEIRLDYNAGYAARFGPHSSCDIDPGSCMNLGLVGYWSFEEGGGNTAYDASGNGNNGTLNNGPTWTTGKIGGALSFDGVDDYVSTVDLSFNGINFSIEVWIKPRALTGQYTILGKPYPEWEYSLMQNNDDIFFIYWNTQGSNCLELYINDLLTTDWHQIVVTADDNGDGKIYFDGIEIDSDGLTGTPINRTNLLNIGRGYYVANGQKYFNGLIDEVKIYNRALSEAEIRYHYNRGGPIAHWKFDEGSGDTASDSSGQGNHGTIYGATWTSGKYGSALSFDGTNDYVAVPTLYSSSPSQITVSAWIKPTISDATQREILYHGDNGEFALILLSGSVKFVVKLTNGIFYETPSVSVSINNWYHVVGVWQQGTSLKLYVNGVGYATSSPPDFTLYDPGSSYEASIGSYDRTSNFFGGLIDDVRVYNYVRTREQILQDYNGGFSTYFR